MMHMNLKTGISDDENMNTGMMAQQQPQPAPVKKRAGM
jgi:hypothetical protein